MDKFLLAAIEEAKKGLAEGGIPIGSVLVRNGVIVGRGHNQRVQQSDPILHAEIDCIRNAGRIGSYRDTILYSTLSPCYLCSGAIIQFGIPKVVAGESVTFPGAPDFLRQHGVDLTDAESEECIAMMRDFIAHNPGLWAEDIGNM
jgi:creatinine deaminase